MKKTGQIIQLPNAAALQRFNEIITTMIDNGESPAVQLVDPKRSLNQNQLAFRLYGQIAEQCGDQTVDDIHKECKLLHGVPILEATDPTFADLWYRIKSSLNYERRLDIMEYMPVTRLMGKQQFSDYIGSVVRAQAKAGRYIEMPGDRY
jgi:hypothetical protein